MHDAAEPPAPAEPPPWLDWPAGSSASAQWQGAAAMLRSGWCCALWCLVVSAEAREAGADVDYDNTTSLFRAAETHVLRFRRSRDENGRGEESQLRDAIAMYNRLQQHPDYTASLPEEIRVLVLDSCEFCHRTLGEYEQALRYAKQLADSRLCQLDADGCFASGACASASGALPDSTRATTSLQLHRMYTQ